MSSLQELQKRFIALPTDDQKSACNDLLFCIVMGIRYPLPKSFATLCDEAFDLAFDVVLRNDMQANA